MVIFLSSGVLLIVGIIVVTLILEDLSLRKSMKEKILKELRMRALENAKHAKMLAGLEDPELIELGEEPVLPDDIEDPFRGVKS